MTDDESSPRPPEPRSLDDRAPWPPPVSGSDQYAEVITHEVQFGFVRGVRVTGRVVHLWGQACVIDEAGDVYCSSCKKFVPIRKLALADNVHPVGLQSIPGAMLPMRGST